MDEKRIKEVLSDGAFVTELLELSEPADVQAALKGKDIDMSLDEIVSLRDIIIRLSEKAGEGGELSLDQLDEAAGGIIGGTAVFVAVTLVATVATGVGVGAAIGGVAAGVMALFSRRW